MRISDWSSDVCSSDLHTPVPPRRRIAWRRPSQWLKSPTTDTRRAEGAQTAKCTPATPSRVIGCAPSTCQSARCEPSAMKCRSEEHTSELQSLMRTSYAVFCLQKKKTNQQTTNTYSLAQTITKK